MKILKYTMVIAAAVIAFGLLRNNKAFAFLPPPTDPGGAGRSISTTSPVPDSAQWNPSLPGYPSGSQNIGGNITPNYDIGNNTHLDANGHQTYPYPNAQFYIYVPSSGSVTVSVIMAGPACYHSGISGGTGLTGPDYSYVSGLGPKVIYTVETTLGSTLRTNSAPESAGCSYPMALTFDAGSCNALPQNQQLPDFQRVCVFNANDNDPVVQGEMQFRVSTSSNALAGFVSATTGYGYRDNNLADGNVWTNQLLFSVPNSCTDLNASVQGDIIYNNADANLYANPNEQFLVQEENWNDANNWTTIANRDHSYLANNNNGYMFGGGGYSFNANHRYRLLLKNVGVRNTIRISIGAQLSQLFSREHYDPDSCGSYSFSCTTNPASTNVAPNTSVPITVTATNTGSTNWDPSADTINLHIFIDGVDQTSRAKALTTTVVPNAQSPPFNFTQTSPTTNNATMTISFAMFRNGTQMGGTPCTTIITTGNGGVGGPTFTCSAQRLDASHILVTVNNTSSSIDVPPNAGYAVSQSPQTSIQTQNYWNIVDGIPHGQSDSNTFVSVPNSAESYRLYNPSLNQWDLADCSVPVPPVQHLFVNCENVSVYNIVASPGQPTYNGNPLGKTLIRLRIGPPNLLSDNQIDTVYKWITVDGSGNENPNPPYQGIYDFYTTFYESWPASATYTVYLDWVTAGNFTSLDPATAWSQASAYSGTESATQGVCLKVQSCTAQSISPIVEPGETTTFTFAINWINYSGDTFPQNAGGGQTSQYLADIQYSGGASGPTGVYLTVPNSGGYSNPYVTEYLTVSGRLNYAGGYTLDSIYPIHSTPFQYPLWTGNCGISNQMPATRPYFQAWNSDVSSGGGFASPSYNPALTVLGSCGDTASGDPPYISPAVGSPGGQYAGGIRAFGNNYTGSGVDFGAVAMGQIVSGSKIGFFSFDKASGSNLNQRPVFANTGVSGLGGYLSGGPPSGCTKDYYTDTQMSPTNISTEGGDLNQAINDCTGRCQYISYNDLTINGASLPVSAGISKQVTLYVDGNLTINGNINYPSSFDATDTKHIPYLAIIVQGDITIGPGVTQLDGLYVAQPTTAVSDDGIFATCPQGTACTSQLIVNGAVIAQKVSLLRVHGTLTSPGSYVGTTPAEIFNFVPSMVIGDPAFAPQPGDLNALFSAAPVF